MKKIILFLAVSVLFVMLAVPVYANIYGNQEGMSAVTYEVSYYRTSFPLISYSFD